MSDKNKILKGSELDSDLLNKRYLKTISVHGLKLDVYLVCRDYVDLVKNPDYTMGSHHYAPNSKYIPKGEIWIDSELGEIGREATIRHESIEYYNMHVKGLDYSHAHNIALKYEVPILKKALKKSLGGKVVTFLVGSMVRTKNGDYFIYEIGGL